MENVDLVLLRKSALLESELLRQDIQNLEDALILHTRFQSESSDSVRGMIRKEIGTSYWEHGGEGKLRTYKSGKDLFGQETRRHGSEYKKTVDIKSEGRESGVKDFGLDMSSKDKENLDASSLKKMFKKTISSATKKTPDVTPVRDFKPELKITRIKTVQSNSDEHRMADVIEVSQGARMKKISLKHKNSFGQYKRSHLRKTNHSTRRVNSEETVQSERKSLHTVPDSSKISNNTTLNAVMLTKSRSEVTDQNKLSLFRESVIDSSTTQTSPLDITDINHLTHTSNLLNTCESNGVMDTFNISLLDSSCATNKHRSNKTNREPVDGLFYSESQYSESKKRASLYHIMFNYDNSELERKYVSFNHSNRAENKDKWATKRKRNVIVGSDVDKIHRRKSYTSGSEDSYSNYSPTPETAQYQSVPSKNIDFLSVCIGESLHEDRKQREIYEDNIPLKEYPHIFKAVRKSPSRVTSPAATEATRKSPSRLTSPATTEATRKSPSRVTSPAATEATRKSPSRVTSPATTEATRKSPSRVTSPATTEATRKSPSRVTSPAATEATRKSPSRVTSPAATEATRKSPSRVTSPVATDNNYSMHQNSLDSSSLTSWPWNYGQRSDADSIHQSDSSPTAGDSMTHPSSLHSPPSPYSDDGQLSASSKPSPLSTHLQFSGTLFQKQHQTDEPYKMYHSNVAQHQTHYTVVPAGSEQQSLTPLNRLCDVHDNDLAHINKREACCDEEVESWLHNLGLQSADHFLQLFRDHQMDMTSVRLLTTSDLREMGIHDLGPIMKIMKGVQILERDVISLRHTDQSTKDIIGRDIVSLQQTKNIAGRDTVSLQQKDKSTKDIIRRDIVSLQQKDKSTKDIIERNVVSLQQKDKSTKEIIRRDIVSLQQKDKSTKDFTERNVVSLQQKDKSTKDIIRRDIVSLQQKDKSTKDIIERNVVSLQQKDKSTKDIIRRDIVSLQQKDKSTKDVIGKDIVSLQQKDKSTKDIIRRDIVSLQQKDKSTKDIIGRDVVSLQQNDKSTVIGSDVISLQQNDKSTKGITGSDLISLQHTDKSNKDNQHYKFMNKSHDTDTPSLTVSHLELSNGSDNINVNNKVLGSDTHETSHHLISLSPILHTQQQRSPNASRKSESSDDHNKILLHSSFSGKCVMKDGVKSEQTLSKKSASATVNVKRSRSATCGKPPTSSKTVENGISVAAQKFLLKQQQQHLKAESDVRTMARHKQMRQKMAAIPIHRSRSSSLDKNTKEGQSSQLERSLSFSTIKEAFVKLQAVELNSNLTEGHGESKDCLDLTLGTVKKLQKCLNHLEKQLIQQNLEKLQQGSSQQQGSLGRSQLSSYHSDDESNPSLPTRRIRSTKERRRQTKDVVQDLANKQEWLASLTVEGTSSSCRTLRSESDQSINQIVLESTPQLQCQNRNNPRSKSLKDLFVYNFEDNTKGGLSVNGAVVDDTNEHDVDAENTSVPLEDVMATISTKNVTSAPMLRPKGIQHASLRVKDTSHARRLPHRQSKRTDMGHNCMMDNIKKVELSRDDICFSEKDLLGSGTFSQVFRGTYQGSEVAVKRLKTRLQARDINYFVAEVSLLQELRHPNVVMLMGVCSSSTDKLPLIVMEFMICGNLHNWLHDTNRPSLSQHEFYQIAHNVSAGMVYLHHHRPSVFHLDLKPKNILIGHGGQAKVADFGFSELKHEANMKLYQSNKSRVVDEPPAWMAPEMLNSGEITSKADIYSFAIVLWEMLSRKTPYESYSVFQILELVRLNRRPTIPANCPKGLSQLVQRCWDQNPAVRPGFKEVLKCLEQLSESKWDTTGEVISVHDKEVVSINLTQKRATSGGHGVKERPLISQRKTFSTTKLDLISLSSEDNNDINNDSDEDVDVSDEQSNHYEDSNRIFTKSLLSFTNNTSRSWKNLCSLEVEDGLNEEKHDIVEEMREGSLSSSKLSVSVSKSQKAMRSIPSFGKLLPLRHSLDRPSALSASFKDSSIKAQDCISLKTEEHINPDLVGGTAPARMHKSLDASNECITSLLCSRNPPDGQEVIDVVTSSSCNLPNPKKDVQMLCNDAQVYLPSFYEKLCSAGVRVRDLSSETSTSSSLVGSNHEQAKDHEGGSLGCKTVDMQSESNVVKSLNESHGTPGLDFNKIFNISNNVSNIILGYGEIKKDSNEGRKICAIHVNTPIALARKKQNRLIVEDKVSSRFIDTNKSQQLNDNTSQQGENKVTSRKDKSLDATGQMRSSSIENIVGHNTGIFEQDNFLAGCERKFSPAEICTAQDCSACNVQVSATCCAEASAVYQAEKLAQVSERLSDHEPELNQHKFVMLSQERHLSTSEKNLANKNVSQTIGKQFTAPNNDSFLFVNELHTSAHESDSESSVIPDDISEDSLNSDEHVTCSKTKDILLKSLDHLHNRTPGEITENLEKQNVIKPKAVVLDTDRVLHDNTEENLFVCRTNMDNISRSSTQPFQEAYSSHHKESDTSPIKCDFVKFDRSGISEQSAGLKNAITTKCNKISSRLYDHPNGKLCAEISTVHPSSNSESVTFNVNRQQISHATTLQEQYCKARLESEDIDSKEDSSLKEAAQKTESAAREVEHCLITNHLFPTSQPHSHDRSSTSELKMEAYVPETQCLIDPKKKLSKPKESLSHPNKQMLNDLECGTHFSVEASILIAQKKLLKSVVIPEPTHPVNTVDEGEESCPTVVAILKKAMADRRFAMRDAQSSQDLSSETSWSVQD